MSYKIAVAVSDGIHIDLSFGEAKKFNIYDVDDLKYSLSEVRVYNRTDNLTDSCGSSNSCGFANESCAAVCGGGKGASPKVSLLNDCRCIICRKIGFNIQKQLEKLAIAGFAVDCTAEEALQKITLYFYRTDRHQSLRGFSRRKELK